MNEKYPEAVSQSQPRVARTTAHRGGARRATLGWTQFENTNPEGVAPFGERVVEPLQGSVGVSGVNPG